MANSYASDAVYPQIWEDRLQKRLNKPTNWKEVCDVRYSDNKIINWPYMSTEFVVQTGTRGTAYGFSDFTITNDTVNINTPKLVPVFIDRADAAQCTLFDFAEAGTRQGALIAEQIESAVLGTFASWTNFGDLGGGALGLGSTKITVTASNIDDIISGVVREIIKANGRDLMNSNGAFFVWRAADFELLETFLRSNGFNIADQVLKMGIQGDSVGYYALGAWHYVSNSHTATHVMAGVRKLLRVGILRSTYGQIIRTTDPLNQSGIGQVARVDYGLQVPLGYATLLFNVNVN